MDFVKQFSDKMRKNRRVMLFLLFFFDMLFSEILVYPAKGNITAETVLLLFMASCLGALFIAGILFFLAGRAYRIAAMLCACMLWFFYLSQAIYNRVFTTFYTVFSMLHGGQVAQFWRQILAAFMDKAIICVLLSIPLVAILLFVRKEDVHEKNGRHGFLTIFSAFFLWAMVVSMLPAGGQGIGTSYHAFWNGGNIKDTAQKIGLMPAFLTDATRTYLGFPQGNTLAQYDAKKPEENEQESEHESIEYPPQTLDIDFEALGQTEPNAQVKQLHHYFSTKTITNKNEMTAKYEGYNLIYITAEGFSPYAIDKTLTPTLYKMTNEGYRFTNFYTPLWGVSTIDGEYINCLGLVPKEGVWSLYQSRENALPFALGNQFQKLGYQTTAYHNHTYNYYRREVSHPNLGYDYKGLGNGLEVTEVWPESDLQMMELTIPEYAENQPFHIYYMTVSGHMEYNFGGNAQSMKHKDLVADLPYSDACKAYIACHIELDKAMEYLLKTLEEKGVLEKTVIAMQPDHYPYGLTNAQISEFLGHEVEPNFELYESTLILYTPDMQPQTVDKPCWSADVLPTLSNLFGLPYDARLLTGRDIFSDSPPFILFANRSFITDKVRYNAATGEAVWTDGQAADEAYLEKMKQAAANEFAADAKIIETNYYAHIGIS